VAAPSYDLAIAGFRDFSRFGRVLDQVSIARDPLSGIVDGTNKVFFTNYYPILTSGSLTVFVSGSQAGGVADYNTGQITLTNAPATQPEATYTFTPYTSNQILQFLLSGLDELELLWFRGWKVVDGSGIAATEDSTQLLVSDKDGNEPITGDTTFSVSRVQIGLFQKCVEYRYLLTQLGTAARNFFSWRETVRGMSVDKSRVPGNIQLSVQEVKTNLMQALVQAQDAYYTGGDHYGGYTPNPVTLDYASNFEWQQASKDEDFRLQLGYHVAYRPILVSYP